MYKYYQQINEDVLSDIKKYEDQQLSEFKTEFDHLCSSIANLYGWNYDINVCRWIDTTYNLKNKPFDGYTATLQIDFTDANGNLVEIDENVLTFFENITYISFNLFRQKYKVFQCEKLVNIRKDIRRLISSLRKHQ